MGYSSLVDYDFRSDSRTKDHYNTRSGGPSNITKLTVHTWAGHGDVSNLLDWWNGSSVSANYGIGSDGKVAIIIDEDYRAWTSSNAANDDVAITIEVANVDNPIHGDETDPTTWEFAPSAYTKLIDLCADICTRHNIDLYYDGTPNGTLTCHWMFDTKSCPGGWFTTRIPQFIEQVKAKMGGSSTTPSGGSGSTTTTTTTTTTVTLKQPCKITFDPEPGLFDNGQTITLSTDATCNCIVYTIDNSVPTPDSKKYAGPILMKANRSVHIRARVFDDGGKVVAQASGTFLRKKPRMKREDVTPVTKKLVHENSKQLYIVRSLPDAEEVEMRRYTELKAETEENQ